MIYDIEIEKVGDKWYFTCLEDGDTVDFIIKPIILQTVKSLEAQTNMKVLNIEIRIEDTRVKE